MSKLLVTDELWSLVEPLVPKHAPSPKGGHPPVPDRVCLTGIVFVLKTGIGWEDFPHEMGCPRKGGMTLWNRLHDWHAAGVWHQLHALLLAELNQADQIDWGRAAVDSSSVRAVHGGKKRATARWIEPNAAASTTSWSTARARRCARRSPAPTRTTSRS